MSFKPDCKQRPPEKSIVTPFNADVVDRNQKWTQRRDEKVSRLKQDQDKSRARDCSFKPKIVGVCLTPDKVRETRNGR